ncbi:MAG TPA: thiol peroxidase, partial [Phycisphaerae bacterium]|nr:thiol peroxidase [Phycisphaerae bacterium]
MARTSTLKGNSLNLEGPELKVGDKAPDAVLRSNLLTDAKLSEGAGKARIYSVVPSLDTPVCAEQTRRFYKELESVPNVDFYTISFDLPTAQARFCGAEGIDTSRFKVFSDAKQGDFGRKYGTLVPDLRINSRAVFVVDKNDKLQYVEYVPEIANHPN